MTKKFEYSIWRSGCGWHVSRLDGRNDKHTEAARLLVNNKNGVSNAKRYFKSYGLNAEVHPIDDDLAKSVLCVDTFEYRKEREYVRQDT